MTLANQDLLRLVLQGTCSPLEAEADMQGVPRRQLNRGLQGFLCIRGRWRRILNVLDTVDKGLLEEAQLFFYWRLGLVAFLPLLPPPSSLSPPPTHSSLFSPSPSSPAHPWSTFGYPWFSQSANQGGVSEREQADIIFWGMRAF